MPDDILRQMPKNGGIVMVTFVPGFISPQTAEHSRRATAETERLRAQFPDDAAAQKKALDAWTAANPAPRATLTQVADHIDHIRKVAGIDHIGLGGDFDGITSVVQGLENVSTYPALLAELSKRGYSDDDIAKITSRNILRVMRARRDGGDATADHGHAVDQDHRGHGPRHAQGPAGAGGSLMPDAAAGRGRFRFRPGRTAFDGLLDLSAALPTPRAGGSSRAGLA